MRVVHSGCRLAITKLKIMIMANIKEINTVKFLTPIYSSEPANRGRNASQR